MDKAEQTTISHEVAEKQLQDFIDYYDIDISHIELETQRSAVRGACDKLVRAIEAGRLELDADCGTAKIHLKKGAVLTCCELSGKAKVEMSRRPEGDMHGRIYALIGSLSGIGFNGIQELTGRDLVVVENLGIVFLLA